MNKTKLYLLLGALVMLSLMTGCYQDAAPDVTPTPAGGAQVAQEGTPDMVGTAEANSALLTQEAQDAQSEAETPTEEPPTSPPPTPTSAPATAIPTQAATASLTPTPAPTVESSSTDSGTHVVQKGENLFRIALRHGSSVEAIANANGITNPALVYVGQKLVIPFSGDQSTPSADGSTYVVQAGDNLFRIALRYNMSYLYLAQHNNITNPSNIYTGQVLRIP